MSGSYIQWSMYLSIITSMTLLMTYVWFSRLDYFETIDLRQGILFICVWRFMMSWYDIISAAMFLTLRWYDMLYYLIVYTLMVIHVFDLFFIYYVYGLGCYNIGIRARSVYVRSTRIDYPYVRHVWGTLLMH